MSVDVNSVLFVCVYYPNVVWVGGCEQCVFECVGVNSVCGCEQCVCLCVCEPKGLCVSVWGGW